MYPALTAYGVNPFSVPALIAFVLSAFNLFGLQENLKKRYRREEGRVKPNGELD